ncbi:MAG: SIMPL domain-containing protein [Rubrivivax sp.]
MTALHRLSFAAFILSLSTATALAQTPVVSTAPPQNVVNVSASATLEVPQDELTIVFGTTREGADANQVQAQLRQALDAALAEARKAARPGQVEVHTGRFSLMPRYSAKGGTSGWIGSAELVVEGRDMVAISQLAGRIGTLSIARTAFGLSRDARQKAEAEITAQAVARFKERADLVARQFGFGAWSLREVSVQGGDAGGPVPVFRAQAMRAAGADEALPVEAGKTQVTVSVSGSVQLSPR